MRAFLCIFAACALLDLAGAQTPTPDSNAADSTATSPKAASDTPAPAGKAADPSVVTVKVAAPAPANTSGVSPETLKAARAAGYQVKTSKGVSRFCRSESEIGQRIPKETCINEDQLAQVLRTSQEQRDRLKSTIGSGTSSH
jgi:hypothetical protein